MVLRGCVARDSRDDVAAELAPYGGPVEVLLAQRCRALYDDDRAAGADPWAWSMPWVDGAVERWRAVLSPRDGAAVALEAETIARLIYPLDHKTLRDRVAGVCLKHSARAKPLLREVVRRAPRDHVAPPATILGLLEWADGDGLRALIAFERALAADPDYSFALLLHQWLQLGIRLPDDFLGGIRDMARKRWRNPSERRPTRSTGDR
jgi:tetratricopeptide (TPR) repeat protein